MSQTQARLRSRMAIQGFVDLPDSVLAGIDPWLRLSPALCMLWVVLGTVLQSPWILAALISFALAGGLALVNVATGFCLPSWLYSRMFGSVQTYRV